MFFTFLLLLFKQYWPIAFFLLAISASNIFYCYLKHIKEIANICVFSII